MSVAPAPRGSATPLAERLQVKRDRRLAIIGPPAGFDIDAPRAANDEAEVVLIFVADRAALDRDLPPVVATMRGEAILWLAYPKRGTPLSVDLDRDLLRGLMRQRGLDTVAQVAVDACWTALRLRPTGVTAGR